MTATAIDPSAFPQALRRTPVDTEPAPYMGISAFLHGLFLILAMLVPPGAAHLELDGMSQHDRFAKIALAPQQQEEDPLAIERPDDSQGAKAAARHAGEEGDAGEPDREETGRRMAIEGPPDNVDVEVQRARDRRVANSAGLAAVFDQHRVNSIWSNDSRSVGAEAVDALGEMDGRQIGDSGGFGGFGVTGTQRGGGDGVEDGFGLSRIDTRGRGPGDDSRDEYYGKDAADLGVNDDKIPDVFPGPPVVDGPLDREIIQRVVRRHRRELAYCYESALQRNPTLAGRVTMKFTIASTGRVIAATVAKSTLDSSTVETCLGRKMRRWNFPATEANGVVVVKYPFRFSQR